MPDLAPADGATAPGTQSAAADLVEAVRRDRAAHPLPAGLRESVERFAHLILELLFPHYAPATARDPAEELDELRVLLLRALDAPGAHAGRRDAIADEFLAELPAIRAALLLDAQAIDDGDPAAVGVDEVIVAYPGFLATAIHRVASALHRLDVPLLPRMLAEVAHSKTGIDIHPAASIGGSFAIDHGTGIVIGATAVLGERVKLYQGVTLGAASVRKELAGKRRHPTIADDVVIYANATILGGDTVIGRGSRIGGNVFLTHSVPPYSIVTPTARVESRSADHVPADDLLEFNI
jgi:serine O-acetyltransferase